MNKKKFLIFAALSLLMMAHVLAGNSFLSDEQLGQHLNGAKGKEKLKLLNALTRHHQFTDVEKHIEYGKKYLASAKEAKSKKDVFQAHLKLAKAFYNKHDIKKSEQHADKAFDISIKYDNDLWYSKALMLQVMYSLKKFKLQDAAIQLDAAERIYKASNRREEMREVLLFRAYIAEYTNQIDKAQQNIERAYVAAENYGDSLAFIEVQSYEADFYSRRGDFIKALTLYNELSTTEKQHNFDFLRASTLVGIASVYLSLDECGKAQEYLEEAFLLSLSSGNIMARARTLKHRGNCHTKQGNFTDAETQYQKALKIFISIDDKLQTGRVNNNLGVIALARNNMKSAENYFNKAIAIYEELPYLYSKAKTIRNLGRLNIKTGSIKAGLEYFQQSNLLATEGNYEEILIMNYQSLADYHESKGEFRKAFSYLKEKNELENRNLNDIYIKLTGMQEKMEKEKQLMQYRLKNATYKRQKLEEKTRLKMLWFSGGVLIFAMIVSFVLYIIWRKKAKNPVAKFAHRNPSVHHDEIDILKARYTFNAIGDGVAWVNEQGRIVYFNKLAESYSSKAQPERIEDLLPKITEQQWQKRWEKMYYEHPYISEEHLIYQDNQPINVEVSMNMLSHDMSVFVAIILKDITSRKKQEKELHRAIEKAKESDHLKTRLINNISHEMRTPLNAINGFISELHEKNSPDEQQKYIENISQSSERLTHLLNEIITVSKIEAENLKVEIKKVNLHNLLNQVIRLYRNELKRLNKPVDIIDDFAFYDREVLIYADEKHYREVLRQLIDNAVKFTEKGEIRVGYHFVEDDMVEVFVQDTGTGIKKEFRPQVFDLFSQADDSDTRKHKGAGLGLSISKKLMMLMRGTLTFDTEEGRGSTFKTTLKGHTIKREEKSQKDAHFSETRAVILTDSTTTGTYLKAMLKKSISSIIIYDNLKEGLKALPYHQPDVLIINQSMIQYGERQICSSVREVLPETKILLLHGGEKFDKQQFDGVIEPNFTKQEISEAIFSVLKK